MTGARTWRRWLLPDHPATRTMAYATVVNTAGAGAYMVICVLYFTRIVGLSAQEVGIGLSIAGGFGLIAGIPMGHLGDRIGARELLIWLLLGCTVAITFAALSTNFWQFVVASSVLAICDRGSAAVRGGLIATTVAGTDRIRARAYLRSMTNVGITLGAAVAAIALHFDTRAAYLWMFVFDGATFVWTAWILRNYPHVDPTPRTEGASQWPVFRDRPYVVMTFLMAAMAIQYSILDIGMPLWLTQETSAPRWMVSVLFVINTAVVVLFQVGVSSRVENATVAARVISVSGFIFFAACVLFALAKDQPAGIAVLFLLLAGFAHVIGELMQAAAQFCLGQDLAAEHAQGQYQGMASTSFSLSGMAAPSIIAFLPLALGGIGWLILGGFFVVVGLALVPVVAWTVRTRDVYARA